MNTVAIYCQHDESNSPSYQCDIGNRTDFNRRGLTREDSQPIVSHAFGLLARRSFYDVENHHRVASGNRVRRSTGEGVVRITGKRPILITWLRLGATRLCGLREQTRLGGGKLQAVAQIRNADIGSKPGIALERPLFLLRAVYAAPSHHPRIELENMRP